MPSVWKKTNETLDVAEQYIAGNNFGFSQFCDGGDVGSAMQWLVETGDHLEPEINYPYTASAGDYATRRNAKKPLDAKLTGDEKYLPLKIFDDVSGNSESGKTPVIKIFQGDYSSKAERLMMQYLSKGFAISVGMYGSNQAFSYYSGGGKVHKGGCKG